MKDPNAYATLEFNKTENANASISANFETFQELQLKACLMPSETKKQEGLALELSVNKQS